MGYYSSVTSAIFFASEEDRDAFIKAHEADLDKVERGNYPLQITTTPPGLVLEAPWAKWYGSDEGSASSVWERLVQEAEEMAYEGEDVSGFFIRIGEDSQNGDIEDTRFRPIGMTALRSPDPYDMVSVSVEVELHHNIR